MSIPSEPIKYFLYARKSSESEDRQMASIEDQINEVEKIAQNLNLSIVGVFSESKSAKAPGRKVFNEMLSQIEAGKANGILCWKLNRLSRNPVDGGKVSWLLQQGVIQHIQCYGRDYKPTDNVLTMQVELGMANQFIKDLSVDIKRGVRAKAERGWYPAPNLPIGYLHNHDRHQKEIEIIPDPIRFPIVQKLWKLMESGGYSLRQIKQEAERMGLLSEREHSYVLSTFHTLFRNEFYKGLFYWRDKDGIKTCYQGKHKPMVSPETFKKVQVQLGRLRQSTRPKSYHFPYRNLLRCGECGCSITAERKVQIRCPECRTKFSCKHRKDCPKCGRVVAKMKKAQPIDITYYRCTKRKQKCSQPYLTQEDLEKQFLALIKRLRLPKAFHAFMLEALEEMEKEQTNSQNKVATQLKKRLSALKKRLQSLSLMRADGELGKEEFVSLKATAQEDITRLEEELAHQEKHCYHWKTIAESHLRFLEEGTKILASGDEKDIRALLMNIGSNWMLKDKKAHFITPKPLLALQECSRFYSVQKGRFELEKPLVKYSDFDRNFTRCSVWCTLLNNVRTAYLQLLRSSKQEEVSFNPKKSA